MCQFNLELDFAGSAAEANAAAAAAILPSMAYIVQEKGSGGGGLPCILANSADKATLLKFASLVYNEPEAELEYLLS